MSDMRRTPAWRAVLVEQFRVLGLSMRGELVLLVVLMTAVSIAATPGHGNAINFRPENNIILAALAGLLPFVVWRGRDQLEGGTFFTMPVEHRRHALARVAAGWVWMLILVAGVLAWLAALVVASGGNFGNPGSTYFLLQGAQSGQIVERSALREFEWVTPAWTWLIALTGPTIAYLLSSALNLATRRPVRVVLAVAVGMLLFTLAAGPVASDVLGFGLDPVLAHPWGLDTVFTGGSESLKTLVLVPDGTSQDETPVWRAIPTFGAYVGATLLWSALATAALWAATRRFREK